MYISGESIPLYAIEFHLIFKYTDYFFINRSYRLLIFVILLIFRLFSGFQSQPFAEFRVTFDALHLLVDYGLGIRLDPVIVALYLLEHDVVAFLVPELIDDRDFPVSLFLRADPGMVHDYFGMENLLVYFLPEVVRHRADKSSLR